MPPKSSSAADKARQKEKEKIAVDKTFGLKNKNKSKSVQKYIKSINQNLTGQSSRADQQERKEKEDKAANAQKSALMNSLFNMQTDKKGRAYDPVAKKAAKQAEEDAIASGKKLKPEIEKEVIEGIANTIRLTNPKTGIRMSELGGHAIIQALKTKHADTFKTIQMLLFIKAREKVFWLDDADSTNPMIRCTADVEAETEPDERSIEEIVEEKRRALTGPGTPVTPETFKAWKEKKAKEKQEKEDKEREEAKKKAGKQALTWMSGKELFSYDASLFQDDADAVGGEELEIQEDGLDSDEEEEREAEDADEEAVDESNSTAPNATAEASAEASGEVVINKDLFLQEADDLDDLDDLDDDDDADGDGKKEEKA